MSAPIPFIGTAGSQSHTCDALSWTGVGPRHETRSLQLPRLTKATLRLMNEVLPRASQPPRLGHPRPPGTLGQPRRLRWT